MSEWQPIETAPTDESHFLAYCEQTNRVVEVVPYVTRRKDGKITNIEWIDWHSNSLSNVKMWMPMPKAPK